MELELMDDTMSTSALCIKTAAGARKNITVCGKKGRLRNIFGSDTVKRRRPQIDDQGYAETRPQGCTYFCARGGEERPSDGILLQDDQTQNKGELKQLDVSQQITHKDTERMEG